MFPSRSSARRVVRGASLGRIRATQPALNARGSLWRALATIFTSSEMNTLSAVIPKTDQLNEPRMTKSAISE